jgi:DNA-binding NarL/FixJ family response regulator
LLEELRPDVLVMDLRLPKLKDGLSLIRSVDELHLAAKIIVLSGWTEELCDLPEEKLVCRVLGKPIRNEHLLEAISAAVSAPARNLP